MAGFPISINGSLLSISLKDQEQLVRIQKTEVKRTLPTNSERRRANPNAIDFVVVWRGVACNSRGSTRQQITSYCVQGVASNAPPDLKGFGPYLLISRLSNVPTRVRCRPG